MKIIDFNRQLGFYRFELTAIETTFHAHPAHEILYSENGSINIYKYY